MFCLCISSSFFRLVVDRKVEGPRPSWGALWASWDCLWPVLRHLEALLGPLGALLDPLGALLGPLGALLGRSGGLLGRSWDLLEGSKIDQKIDPKIDPKSSRIREGQNRSGATPADVSEGSELHRHPPALRSSQTPKLSIRLKI